MRLAHLSSQPFCRSTAADAPRYRDQRVSTEPTKSLYSLSTHGNPYFWERDTGDQSLVKKMWRKFPRRKDWYA
ncbi:hypothetical protein BDV10DRAFT_178878, partial [Aspergillus recurvatus]